MPQFLYPQGKSPRYPLDRRLGRPQSCLDAVVKRKMELEPPIIQPIAQYYNNELSWLLATASVQCKVNYHTVSC
jgi:hypothetical protein